MKKVIFIALSCILAINFNIKADDAAISKGIDFFEAGMYEPARQFFKAQTANGMAYYYLGEIAYAEGKTDSASYYYDKGLATDKPYSLCYVGKGKLMLKTNLKEAEATMQKVFVDKASKKDPAIYTAIGLAYAANKMNDKAKASFKQARDFNRNYAPVYIAEGDLSLTEEKLNEAANKYDMAAYVDKKNKLSRLKLADIYSQVNPEQAMVSINELLSLDPDYAPAYKQLGELHFNNKQYEKAGEAYARYLSFGTGSITEYARYATILYLNKEYRSSLAEAEKALVIDPDNTSMKRLSGYNLFEMEEYERALSVMNTFMNDSKSNFISSDYKYYARTLRKNKQDLLSIDYYQKALEFEQTNKSDILQEISQAYESMKNHAMAASFSEQFIENTPTANAADYFNCGQQFYFAGKDIEIKADADSLEQIRLYQKADHFFAIVAERSPSHYLGNFWRARVQYALDPDVIQGLAKPYYEQAVAILEASPSKNSNDLLECYRYLAYYFLEEDKETSISYWNKVLAIEPTNQMALNALKLLKKK